MDVLMTYHTTSKSYGNKLLYYSVGASEEYPTPFPTPSSSPTHPLLHIKILTNDFHIVISLSMPHLN